MAIYAIGDVHGCLSALQNLLCQMRFHAGTDRLWLTGDLVNRGPHSADVLRMVMDFGDAAQAVLGNHDFHLLTVASGAVAAQPHDTFHDVLDAPDADALLGWLRRRPLAAVIAGSTADAASDLANGDALLVHAGVHRDWNSAQVLALGDEVAQALRGDNFATFMAHLYGNEPAHWCEGLSGWARLRCITNILTRMRYCRSDGSMVLRAADARPTARSDADGGNAGSGVTGNDETRGALGDTVSGSKISDETRGEFVPWYALPGRKTHGRRIVFGHWAALGLYAGDGVLGLDSGCVWGGALSGARLDVMPPVIYQVACGRGV